MISSKYSQDSFYLTPVLYYGEHKDTPQIIHNNVDKQITSNLEAGYNVTDDQCSFIYQ